MMPLILAPGRAAFKAVMTQAGTNAILYRMPLREMTYRVVSLHSREAGDARLGATIAERLRMVDELSRAAWMATGRAFPRYTRRDIPFRLSTLREHSDR
jgi:hypothetical protein